MTRGYARVSTQQQDLGRQIQDLNKYGCEIIYQEKISGKQGKRPELERMLEDLQPGDVVVIHKLDRLGRSLQHLIELVNGFKDRSVDFISLNDNFNTTTSQGKLIFNIMASIAEFERELIRERTISGLKYVQSVGTKSGKPIGRPDKTKDQVLIKELIEYYSSSNDSVQTLSKKFGMSKQTVYKIFKEQGVETSTKQKTL